MKNASMTTTFIIFSCATYLTFFIIENIASDHTMLPAIIAGRTCVQKYATILSQ